MKFKQPPLLRHLFGGTLPVQTSFKCGPKREGKEVRQVVPRPHSEHLRNVAGLGRVGEVLAGKSHSPYTVVFCRNFASSYMMSASFAL